jgi:hypothetical protein
MQAQTITTRRTIRIAWVPLVIVLLVVAALAIGATTVVNRDAGTRAPQSVFVPAGHAQPGHAPTTQRGWAPASSDVAASGAETGANMQKAAMAAAGITSVAGGAGASGDVDAATSPGGGPQGAPEKPLP